MADVNNDMSDNDGIGQPKKEVMECSGEPLVVVWMDDQYERMTGQEHQGTWFQTMTFIIRTICFIVIAVELGILAYTSGMSGPKSGTSISNVYNQGCEYCGCS